MFAWPIKRRLVHFTTFKFQLAAFVLLALVPAAALSQQEAAAPADSLSVAADSVPEPSPGGLDSRVIYSARDSIRFDVAERKVFLYGDAKINYESTELKAGYVEIDWNTSTVFAGSVPDSTGASFIRPVFTDAGESFTAQTITYNFRSKKGRISEVITQEGDGYVHGETVKKDSGNVFYIRGGAYTTCSLEHPHYSIRASRLKVIPHEKIITGPAYLVVEDVPTPLAVPFGMFPNRSGRTSGILVPAYGESATLGFFLQNGGYYFAISDHLDLQVRGDIYSRGSWGLKGASSYARRYRFSGRVETGWSKLKFSDPEFPDFSLSEDFYVRWTHSQDPKARPQTRFSANVNVNSGNYFRNNSYNPTDVLTNEFQSNVSWSKSWTGRPYNLSANLRHRQNTTTKIVNLGLPELAFTVNRRHPFKRKTPRTKARWLDQFGVSYTSNLRNDLQVADSLLFTDESIRQFRNGMRHSVPVSTSFRLFRYFTFAPSFTYNERWYMQTIEKEWDEALRLVRTDTLPGFRAARDYAVSSSLTTKIYGLVQFGKDAPVKAIRHVLTPSVGMSYRPDFAKVGGYYKTVQTDTTGAAFTEYSVFEQGIYGAPPKGESGMVSFSFQNNLEMKIRPAKKDTSNTLRKVKLIENLAVSSAYDIARDSLNWSVIGLSGRTSIFKNMDVTFSSAYDPYVMDSAGRRLNRFELSENNRPGRLTSMNAALNLALQHGGRKSAEKESGGESGGGEEINMINAKPDAYVDFSVPWTLNISYNLGYSKPVREATVTQSFMFSGDVKMTEKWKVGFTSGYDFERGEFNYTTINVFRDLHCWEMRFTWIPFGFRQSYNVTINVKSSVLQDLKLTKKKDWYDQ